MSEVRQPIYLDYQATTPCDPEVVDAMLPYFSKLFGNASSKSHAYGWDAEKAVENARKQVADSIGANSKDIVFTSGATESNNLALKGIDGHIVTTSIEHKSVLENCGTNSTLLNVDKTGRIDLDQLDDAITDRTALVSVIFANNEIGTIQDIKSVGEITKKKNVLLHTDAVQAFGKFPINVRDINIDLLSLSGHKIYAPKGIGALYVRQSSPRVKLTPLLLGGGQERGLRAGTLNVPAIVGLGKACEIATERIQEDNTRFKKLRTDIVNRLKSEIDGVSLNGSPEHVILNNISMTFQRFGSDELIRGLKKLAFSTGSACSSSNTKPSHVLKAIGLTDDEAARTIRWGLGRFTTQAEVEIAIDELIDWVRKKS